MEEVSLEGLLEVVVVWGVGRVAGVRVEGEGAREWTAKPTG